MSDYLKPKVSARGVGKRSMEDGMFRNPPTYTELGGFKSERNWTDPVGKRNRISGMSLERGGPGAQKGKPV